MIRAASFCACVGLVALGSFAPRSVVSQEPHSATAPGASGAQVSHPVQSSLGSPTRQQKAMRLVGSVEAGVSRFPVETQVELLLQLAQANQNLSLDNQKQLLQQAFETSAAISDSHLQANLQHQIVLSMKVIDPNGLAALRGSVGAHSRTVVDDHVFLQYMREGKFDAAVDLLSHWDPSIRFPYFQAVDLMQRLPAQQAAERQAVFGAAVAAFRRDDNEKFSGFDSLDRLILNCYSDVPAEMARDAIELFLARTKAKNDPSGVTLSGNRGTVTFNSVYAANLFRMLPILQKIDPAKAQRLLREEPSVATELQRHPAGIASLGLRTDGPPNPAHPEDNVMRTIILKPEPGTSLVDLQIAEQEDLSDAIVDRADKDYKAALSDAQKLINQSAHVFSYITTPRCEALLGIANKMLETSNYGAAREAVHDLIASANELPALIRVNYLAKAAAVSARIGDPEHARQLILLGMKAAADLYQSDAFGTPPNSAAKIVWPSTAAWKDIGSVAARMDPDLAIDLAETIPDQEIEATSNSLLLESC